jgi:signal transduction histidine kinase
MKTPDFREIWKTKRFVVSVLAISLLMHCSAMLIAVWDHDRPFRLECAALICASFLLDAAGVSLKKVAAFRLVHASRAFFLGLAFSLGGSSSVLVPILLASIYLVELPEFDAGVWCIGQCAFYTLAFTLELFILRRSSPGMPFPLFAISFVSFVAPIALLGYAAMSYREALAGKCEEGAMYAGTIRNLISANMAFQRYASDVESESAEKERNRITRELHDSIGYALSNVIMAMNAGKVLLRDNPTELGGLLDSVGAQAEEALDATRQILHILRDIGGDEPVGLQGVAQLAQNFEKATGVKISMDYGNMEMSHGRLIDSAIFRLVQEGLTNAFRHGRATKVFISMRQTTTEIEVAVRDNGRGVQDETSIVEGIGFRGMRERLAEFGGTIRPRNVPDGFELWAVIPYHVRDIDE